MAHRAARPGRTVIIAVCMMVGVLWAAGAAAAPQVNSAGKRVLTMADLETAAARTPTLLDKMREQCQAGPGGEAKRTLVDVQATCHMLGRYFEDHERVADSAELYQRACDLGVAEACTDVGLLHHTGDLPTGVDLKAAFEQYLTACEWLGDGDADMNACRALGLMYDSGEGVEADLKAARRYLRRACKAGLPRACHELGEVIRKEVGDRRGATAKRDMGRALKLFRRACGAAVADGCVAAAEVLADGVAGIKQSRPAAARLLSQACHLESGGGCVRLAMLTEYGAGVERDIEEAMQLYLKACRLGEAVACAAAGTHYEEGHEGGVAHNHGRAVTLLTRSCKLGSDAGCQLLAQMGEEVPPHDQQCVVNPDGEILCVDDEDAGHRGPGSTSEPGSAA